MVLDPHLSARQAGLGGAPGWAVVALASRDPVARWGIDTMQGGFVQALRVGVMATSHQQRQGAG